VWFLEGERGSFIKSVVFFNFSLDNVKNLGSGNLFGKILDGEVCHIHTMSNRETEDEWERLGSFRHLQEENLLVLNFDGCVGINSCIGILRYHGNNLRDAYVLHDQNKIKKFGESLNTEKVDEFFKGVDERLFVDFFSESNIYSRIREIVDTDLLKGKCVTIVGLGTGGSRVAIELAKAGVGNFNLIDYDRLETHNISRYVKGVSDLGRLKVNVIADLLLDINPQIKVSKYPLRINKETDEFRKIVESSDIVIDATGSPLINQLVNSTCWELGKPSVYAGAFERAIGLYVLSVQPPNTPCYNCVFEKVFSKYTPPRREFVDYTEVSDPSELRAEPGLSISVGFGALLQAWYALQILLGEKSKIGSIEHQMILWGNRGEWIFSGKKIPSILFGVFKRNESCPVCRESEWIKEQERKMEITEENLERLLTEEEKELLENITGSKQKKDTQ
jgi:molybdopterin/thiamine biosynthesis adenylyltransferase